MEFCIGGGKRDQNADQIVVLIQERRPSKSAILVTKGQLRQDASYSKESNTCVQVFLCQRMDNFMGQRCVNQVCSLYHRLQKESRVLTNYSEANIWSWFSETSSRLVIQSDAVVPLQNNEMT